MYILLPYSKSVLVILGLNVVQKFMKLKSLFILIGVVLLVSVVVYAANYKGDTEDINQSNQNGESSMQTEDETVEDMYVQCKENCTKVLSGEAQTTCLQACETAKNVNSSSLADCESLSDDFRDGCIVKKAVELKDLDACETIVSNTLKATCYTGLAKELKDREICERIPEGILKLSCFEKLK